MLCIVIAAIPTLATASVSRIAGPGDARVGGTFVMSGVVTVAVDVRGERPGERVTRRWVISARGCSGGSVCDKLLLTRNRGPVRGSFVVLRRVGRGRFRGVGAFWSALRCLGHTHRLGSRAPYTIALSVTRRRRIGSVWYATALRATYANRSRSDGTRCPLGPAHDAARYEGRLTSRLPKPPPPPYSIKHSHQRGRVAADGRGTAVAPRPRPGGGQTSIRSVESTSASLRTSFWGRSAPGMITA